MSPLVLLIVVLLVLSVGGTGWAVQHAGRKSREERMMSVIRGRAGNGKGARSDKDLQNKRRAEIAKKLKDGGDGVQKKGKIGTKELLMQAGLTIPVRRYWLASLGVGLVTMLLALVMKAPMLPVTVPLAGIVGVLGLPRLFLRRKIKKRQKKFLMEFADALEAMVRLLKAGMPVAEAIRMASREFTGPVGEEMSRIYDSQKIGVPLPEACLDAARRMPITEMQMFATGITIQQQTGSSLSEVLMNLAGVIRARFKLKRKVQALSSEAKTSAAIIGALPFLVGSGLMLINGEYMDPLFHTTTGNILIAFGLFWMSCGIFVMKIMINFKV